MKIRAILAAIAFLAAVPVSAERLNFDHRIYAPLKAAFDRKDEKLMFFDGSNPRYLYNRIAVQGRSADDWSEAMEIISRSFGKNMRTAQDWYGEVAAQAPRGCKAVLETIAEDANSITFSRHIADCPTAKAQSALYRIVAGEKSLFLLSAQYKGEFSPAMREQWLALFASAAIK